MVRKAPAAWTSGMFLRHWKLAYPPLHPTMPDIAFFRNEQIPHFQENYIPVAPALVCEILSPSTGHLDIGPKFTTYEEQGVEEYWILDPVNLRHRFYAREERF